MLKTFILNVETFAGSLVNDVAAELCILADRLDMRIAAKFNDCELWARPGDDPSEIVKSFLGQIDSNNTVKICQDESNQCSE